IPIDKRKTGAVLDGAMNEAVARKSTARPSANQGMTVESFQPRLETRSGEPPEQKSKAPLWIGLGVAAVALAGGGYYFMGSSKSGGQAPTATAQKPVTAAPAAAAQNAQDAGADKPIGDNALLYYRSAAAADPNSGEAKEGLQRVANVAASRFDESLSAAKYDEASLALANLKVASPVDSRIGAFDLKLFNAQIAKALAENNIDRALGLV